MDILDFWHIMYKVWVSLYKKMPLTQAQIARLGKLTSLKTQNNLSVESVLDSFDSLAQIDVSMVHLSNWSGRHTLSLREDIVIQDAWMADDLLSCSPQKKLAHQIVLGGIIAWE